ncbi:MAG: hypothetical protein HQM16_06295 [Deltaproteobacteria bacterium]|nr:hypothetical protein [Deltaproteobacteria bacterium]
MKLIPLFFFLCLFIPNTVLSAPFNYSTHCHIDKADLEDHSKGNAACLIFVDDKLLVVQNGIDISLPGGEPLNPTEVKIEESSRHTACRNTLEEVLGLRLSRQNQISVKNVFNSDKDLTLYQCELNEATYNHVIDNAPYKVIDGNLKRNGIFEVRLIRPESNPQFQFKYPATLVKKITGLMGR